MPEYMQLKIQKIYASVWGAAGPLLLRWPNLVTASILCTIETVENSGFKSQSEQGHQFFLLRPVLPGSRMA